MIENASEVILVFNLAIQHFLNTKYSKNKYCEILLQFKRNVLFISVIKAVFSASLLQSSVSHDHEYYYNMLLDKRWKTFGA